MSDLSRLLGLDKHKSTLAAINTALQGAATPAAVSVATDKLGATAGPIVGTALGTIIANPTSAGIATAGEQVAPVIQTLSDTLKAELVADLNKGVGEVGLNPAEQAAVEAAIVVLVNGFTASVNLTTTTIAPSSTIVTTVVGAPVPSGGSPQ